jgi:hypothetical protein
MKKRILSLIFLILLLSLTISQAFGEIDHYLYLEGLSIKVEAPDEVKVNEEFNVVLDIHPYEEIYIKSLIVSFGYSWRPFYKETLFYQQNVSEEFSKTYILKTKDYDRVPCTIEISYVRWKGNWLLERSYEETFSLDLTDVPYITKEELVKDYDSLHYNYSILYSNYTWLKSDYESLRSRYEKLERDYNSLSEKLQEQYRDTNIFFLTTMIFLASTIYLEWKVRKIGKEQKKSDKQKGEGLIKEIESLFFKVD